MAATIRESEKGIEITTPFDRDFVDDLKTAIPCQDRSWDRQKKAWVVAASAIDEALKVTGRYFEIIDLRGASADEADDALIEAELSKIEADQGFIRDNEARVEKMIKALDAAIARYSFRSKSAVKGAMAKDRALLAHSLSSAEQSPESLVELQVRGLTAARRLIESGPQKHWDATAVTVYRRE